MKHNWKRYQDLFTAKRRCENCCAEQSYNCISYDRMSGSRYAWSPKVGRCKPKVDDK